MQSEMVVPKMFDIKWKVRAYLKCTKNIGDIVRKKSEDLYNAKNTLKQIWEIVNVKRHWKSKYQIKLMKPEKNEIYSGSYSEDIVCKTNKIKIHDVYSDYCSHLFYYHKLSIVLPSGRLHSSVFPLEKFEQNRLFNQHEYGVAD